MDNTFNYMFLGRLKQDCKYYLGNGNRNKKHLYFQNEKEHITEMKKLHNTFAADKKPQWLQYEEILEYEKSMIENN